jgi:hypothetical protein
MPFLAQPLKIRSTPNLLDPKEFAILQIDLMVLSETSFSHSVGNPEAIAQCLESAVVTDD